MLACRVGRGGIAHRPRLLIFPAGPGLPHCWRNPLRLLDFDRGAVGIFAAPFLSIFTQRSFPMPVTCFSPADRLNPAAIFDDP